VFLDFREVFDSTGDYGRIAHHLNGAGVPDMHQAMRDLQLAPVNEKLRELVSEASLNDFIRVIRGKRSKQKSTDDAVEILTQKYERFVHQVATHVGQHVDVFKIADHFRMILLDLREIPRGPSKTDGDQVPDALLHLDDRKNALLLFSWIVIIGLHEFENVFELLQLERLLSRVFGELETGHEESRLMEILFFHHRLFADPTEEQFPRAVLTMLDRQEVHDFIHVNQYKGIWYFNKERFEEVINWLYTASWIEHRQSKPGRNRMLDARKRFIELKQLAKKSGYRFDDVRNALRCERPKTEIRV
jgi:hypothetical protein